MSFELCRIEVLIKNGRLRILNPLTGRNQIQGAVVMGIGMALFEETTYDPQNGAPINSNLADYIMTVNADAPPIDVHFLDYPDKEINELGAALPQKVRRRAWTQSVQGAVATWSVISMRYFLSILDSHP